MHDRRLTNNWQTPVSLWTVPVGNADGCSRRSAVCFCYSVITLRLIILHLEWSRVATETALAQGGFFCMFNSQYDCGGVRSSRRMYSIWSSGTGAR
jgi:hypothetical protein